MQRAIEITARTFRDAGLPHSAITACILVGGMTRMPRVQQAVQTLFGLPPSKGVHPDEVVACGAAIQGMLLSSHDTDTLLLDVTPHNLGIMVAGGLLDVIIEKDTTIPTTARKTFTTVRDGQQQVRILVLQGESSRAEENELLGEFVLDGLRDAPRGEVKIEVAFDISADGIVGVAARDRETGREQAITVTASSGLTEEQILDMATRTQDLVNPAGAEGAAFEADRVTAERLLAEVDALLPRARPIIVGTDFGADALNKAEKTIQRARRALSERDHRELGETLKPLERTLSLLRSVVQKLGRA